MSLPPVNFAEVFTEALAASKPWPQPLQLDLLNTVASRELHLHYKDERERLMIMQVSMTLAPRSRPLVGVSGPLTA